MGGSKGHKGAPAVGSVAFAWRFLLSAAATALAVSLVRGTVLPSFRGSGPKQAGADGSVVEESRAVPEESAARSSPSESVERQPLPAPPGGGRLLRHSTGMCVRPTDADADAVVKFAFDDCHAEPAGSNVFVVPAPPPEDSVDEEWLYMRFGKKCVQPQEDVGEPRLYPSDCSKPNAKFKKLVVGTDLFVMQHGTEDAAKCVVPFEGKEKPPPGTLLTIHNDCSLGRQGLQFQTSSSAQTGAAMPELVAEPAAEAATPAAAPPAAPPATEAVAEPPAEEAPAPASAAPSPALQHSTNLCIHPNDAEGDDRVLLLEDCTEGGGKSEIRLMAAAPPEDSVDEEWVYMRFGTKCAQPQEDVGEPRLYLSDCAKPNAKFKKLDSGSDNLFLFQHGPEDAQKCVTPLEGKDKPPSGTILTTHSDCSLGRGALQFRGLVAKGDAIAAAAAAAPVVAAAPAAAVAEPVAATKPESEPPATEPEAEPPAEAAAAEAPAPPPAPPSPALQHSTNLCVHPNDAEGDDRVLLLEDCTEGAGKSEIRLMAAAPPEDSVDEEWVYMRFGTKCAQPQEDAGEPRLYLSDCAKPNAKFKKLDSGSDNLFLFQHGPEDAQKCVTPLEGKDKPPSGTILTTHSDCSLGRGALQFRGLVAKGDAIAAAAAAAPVVAAAPAAAVAEPVAATKPESEPPATEPEAEPPAEAAAAEAPAPPPAPPSPALQHSTNLCVHPNDAEGDDRVLLLEDCTEGAGKSEIRLMAAAPPEDSVDEDWVYLRFGTKCAQPQEDAGEPRLYLSDCAKPNAKFKKLDSGSDNLFLFQHGPEEALKCVVPFEGKDNPPPGTILTTHADCSLGRGALQFRGLVAKGDAIAAAAAAPVVAAASAVAVVPAAAVPAVAPRAQRGKGDLLLHSSGKCVRAKEPPSGEDSTVLVFVSCDEEPSKNIRLVAVEGSSDTFRFQLGRQCAHAEDDENAGAEPRMAFPADCKSVKHAFAYAKHAPLDDGSFLLRDAGEDPTCINPSGGSDKPEDMVELINHLNCDEGKKALRFKI
ncbi:unnamed protein product [Polarella glacialis]|uniref:Uncharacterized protein n=1 Tax=Polarella glacialis TaxID=89957 RepID=A0A813DUN2_POLGL|nr:unnamed protein product [Polarella glacialis]